jgi:Ca-activated chloride channel family protein
VTFLRLDLFWAAFAIFVAVVAVRRLARHRAVASTTTELLMGPAYRASAWRHLPLGLATGALGLVLCGLLQPVLPIVYRDIRVQGLDIVLVIDLSLSMTQPIGVRDGRLAPGATPGPARIEAVKQALRTFIERRPDDRIGVVVFSDNSYVVSPLTFDHEHLLGYFSVIDPQAVVGEGQTAMGDGIDTGMLLLGRQSTSERRNKVLMVFTDGASNMGRDPVQSLEEATRGGTRVHLVGVDFAERSEPPAPEDILVGAIESRGGRYFAADSPADLDAAARSLDGLEQGEIRARTYERNEPLVQWFALPALGVLLAAVGLRAVPVLIGLH